MKNNSFKFILGIIFTGVIFFSCSKVNDFKDEIDLNQPSLLNLKSTNAIKAYLNESKNGFDNRGKSTVDSIISTAKWDLGIEKRINKHESIVYIPFNRNDFGLTVYFNSTLNKVDSCQIIALNSKTINSTRDIIDVLFNLTSNVEISNTSSYSISNYSINNKFKAEITYKDGKFYSKKEIKVSLKKIKQQIVSNVQCWDHWLVTTYGDGSQTYTYLYTTCDDNCYEQIQGISIFSGGTYKIINNCGGGSTTSYTPPEPPLCSNTVEEARALLDEVDFRGYSGMSSISPTGPQQLDENTGIIREPFVIHRDVLEIRFRLGFSSIYEAAFTGVRYKLATNYDNWKFESINYAGISERNSNMPPCYEAVVSGIGSPCVISGDLQTAQAHVSTSGILKISCVPGGWAQKTYYSYSFLTLEAKTP